MKIFTGKTAVITGGAGGIGYALAEVCTAKGMKIVLADIEADTLNVAAKKLRGVNTEVVTAITDVSKPEQVEALAAKAFETFGAVHLLFNNAGVSAGSGIWETTELDWDWVMGVNFGGVLNGVRTFVPRMIAQNEAAHIINTASIGGLVSYHPSATYQVSKHAVVALSEHLYHSLNLQRTKIGVSVLCPGWVKTRILAAERNRPKDGESSEYTDEEIIVRESFARAVENGMTPEEIAEITFQAIEKNQFYILPDPRWKKMIRQRLDDLIGEKNPSSNKALTEFLDDGQAVMQLVSNFWGDRLRNWVQRTFRKAK